MTDFSKLLVVVVKGSELVARGAMAGADIPFSYSRSLRHGESLGYVPGCYAHDIAHMFCNARAEGGRYPDGTVLFYRDHASPQHDTI